MRDARLTRRDVLSSAVSLGVSAGVVSAPAWTQVTAGDAVEAIVRKTIGIDTHNHIDVQLDPAKGPSPDIDLAGDFKRSGLAAICMTFAVDYKSLDVPGEAHARFLAGVTAMDGQLRRNGIRRALDLGDIQNAHASGHPIVVQAVEGAHFLEGEVERLEEPYGRGLRHLGLLHDRDAAPPLGDVYTNPPRLGGLTSLGGETIRVANRLGMLVDLTRQRANRASGNGAFRQPDSDLAHRSRYAAWQRLAQGGRDETAAH